MVGFFVAVGDGFAVGVGDALTGRPSVIEKVIGDLLSAWVPVASLNPMAPDQTPAGTPLILNLHDPLVERTTV